MYPKYNKDNYQSEKGWYEHTHGMCQDGTWYGLKNGERVTIKGNEAIEAMKKAKKNPILGGN